MPCCCLGVFALVTPRITLAVMWIVGYTRGVFETYLWPILGFLFLPYTTCAYVLAERELNGPRGLGLALIIIGVILDIGGHGGSAESGRRYHRKSYISGAIR